MHPDLDLINVTTGEKQTPVTVNALKQAYPEWFAKTFGEQTPSIFFPILSPDLKRVFFKMALATGENPRSKSASARQALEFIAKVLERFPEVVKENGWRFACATNNGIELPARSGDKV